MKKLLLIGAFMIMAGCADKPKVVLPVGTKVICTNAADVRLAFWVDLSRTGKVVELTKPLVLTE